MTYETVIAYSLSSINTKVNDKLAQGWRVQGGVTMASHAGGLYYAQAMVKAN